jgi:FMN phosphatase YigB (HAD superfamily)
MLKLIVFDCDGVMFDSRRANQEYYNVLLHHFNQPLMSDADLEYVHMNNVTDSVRHIFRHSADANLDEVDAFREELGYLRFLPFMKMEEDLVDFLEITKPRYHLAISTNRSNTMLPLLRSFHLEGYFGKVMTAENARRPKPAPDALEEILEYYGCLAEETIFIGDSIIDREHSRACNVSLIAFKNPALPAEYHVSSFMEILRLPPLQNQG